MTGKLKRMDASHWFLTREAINARGNGRLVGEVARDATLVAHSRSPDERRVVDQAVLGGVATRLQRSEQRLLRAQDLYGRGGVLSETGQAAGLRDEAGTNLATQNQTSLDAKRLRNNWYKNSMYRIE